MKTGGSKRLGFTAPAFIVALILLAGCVHAPLNQPLIQKQSMGGAQIRPQPLADSTDELEVWLFFSGGGTRAAALSYGVLKELARTPVPGRQPKRRMLD